MQIKKSRQFQRVISWLLIIVLLIPNAAFAGTFLIPVTVVAHGPWGEAFSTDQIQGSLTLKVYDYADANQETVIETFVSNTSGEFDLTTNSNLSAQKYIGIISGENVTNYTFLPSDPFEIDLTNADTAFGYAVGVLNTPILRGNILKPDAFPIDGSINVTINGPLTNFEVYPNGNYEADIYLLGSAPTDYYVSTTTPGYQSSIPITLDRSMLTGAEIYADFILQPDNEMLVFNVKTPSGNSATSVGVHKSYRTQGGSYETVINGSTVTISGASANDGEYAIYAYSTENNLDAMSAPFIFYVSNHQFFSDKECTMPLNLPQDIALREGLLLGTAHHSDNTLKPGGHVNLNKEIAPGQFDWWGGFQIKSLGTVVVPKEDGSYSVNVFPSQNLVFYTDPVNFTISGDTITGEGSLEITEKPVQLFGKSILPDLSVNPSNNFEVKFTNTTTNDIYYSQTVYNDGFEYYIIGGLPNGEYSAIMAPTNHEVNWYQPSSTAIITVTNGTVNPSTLDFQLNPPPVIPYSLVDNYNEFIFAEKTWITMDAAFKSVGASSFEQFSFNLNEKIGENYTEVLKIDNTIIQDSFFETYQDGNTQLRVVFHYPSVEWLPEETLYIGVTDTVLSETVYVPITKTNTPIIRNMGYTGVDNGTVYHFAHIESQTYEAITYTLLDEQGDLAGSGEMHSLDPMNPSSYVATSTLIEGKTPVKFVLDNAVFSGDYLSRYENMFGNLNPLIKVSSDEQNHTIKMYHHLLSATDFPIFEVYDAENQNVYYSKATDPEFSITPLSEFGGGVQIEIPLSKLPSNTNLDLRFKVGNETIETGSFNFENINSKLMSVNIMAPDGFTPINAFEFELTGDSSSGYFDAEKSGGTFILKDAADGIYRIFFTSLEDDTYAASDYLTIRVENGIAYSSLTENTPFPVESNMNLKDGVYVGIAKDVSGNALAARRIHADRRIGDHEWETIPAIYTKPNGAIILPSIDGTYGVNLYNENVPGVVGDWDEFIVSSGMVQNPRDLQLSVTQLSGTVFMPDGSFDPLGEYDILIFDAFNQLVNRKISYSQTDTSNSYALSGLVDGSYTIRAIPTGSIANTKFESAPISFEVSNQIAVPAIIDLTLSDTNITPFKLLSNNVLRVSALEEIAELDIVTEGIRTQDLSQIKFELYKTVSGETDPQLVQILDLNNTLWTNIHENHLRQTIMHIGFWMDDVFEVGNYFIKVTDLSNMNQSITVNFECVDAILVNHVAYLGTVDGKYHHLVQLNQGGQIQLTGKVYNESGTVIGSVSIDQYGLYPNTYLMTTETALGTPTKFSVDNIPFQRTYHQNFDLTPQPDASLMSLESDTNYYYIKYLNQALTLENAINLEIFNFSDTEVDGIDTAYPTIDHPFEQPTLITEGIGGLVYRIPKDAITPFTWYELGIRNGEEVRAFMNHFFVEEDALVLKLKLTDPTGNASINRFDAAITYYTPNTTFDFQRIGSTMYFYNADDGIYSFVMSSYEDDTHASSESIMFYVKDGIAYKDETCTVPFEDLVTVKTRPGVYAGTATYLDASPIMRYDGSIDIYKFNTEANEYQYFENIVLKDSGKIYLPNLSGTYMLDLRVYDDLYFGSRRPVTISDGSVSSPVALFAQDVQISGNAFLKAGIKLTEPHFNVYVVNENNEWVENANTIWFEGNTWGYKLGGLAPGNYKMILQPYFEFASIGYVKSDAVNFSINAQGVPSAAKIDLMFNYAPKDFTQLQALITKAETIDTIGMTSESRDHLVQVILDAKDVLANENHEWFDEVVNALNEAILGLQIMKPTLLVSSDVLTNQDVSVTYQLGFDPTGTPYKVYASINNGFSWELVTSPTLTILNNTIIKLRVELATPGYVYEVYSDQITISNIDKIKPFIALSGDKTQTLSYGAPFNDAGYLVTDNVSEAGNINVAVTGAVNTAVIGSYTLTYTATDEAGNKAITTRTVKVVDTIKPTVSVKATDETVLPESIKVIGDSLFFKVTASDAYDGSNVVTTVTMNGQNVVAIAGTYEAPMIYGVNYLKVTVKDTSGNIAQKTITVENVNITITASETKATNADVTLTASLPELFRSPTFSPSTAVISTNGTTAFTAVITGLTSTSKVFSYEVSNIDKVSPNAPVLSTTNTEPTKVSTYLILEGEELLEFQLGSGNWNTYTGSIEVTDNVIVNSRAKDAAGNITPGNSISVTWIDKTAPVISVPVTLLVNDAPFNSSYILKPGDTLKLTFTATEENGQANAYIKMNSMTPIMIPVTTGVPVSYSFVIPENSSLNNTLRLWIEDEAGNRTLFSGIDTLTVTSSLSFDVKAPSITLVGGDMTLPVGGTYNELGAVAYDDIDGELITTIIGTANTEDVGDYVISYSATDGAGNPSPIISRTVHVVDNIKPVIDTTLGNLTVNKASFNFEAKAEDNVGVTSFIVKQGSTIITGVNDVYSIMLLEGNNTFTLEAIDAIGNKTTLTYVVNFLKLASGTPVISASTLAPTNQPITVSIDYPEGAFKKEYAVGTPTTWLSYTAPLVVNTANATIFARTQQTTDSLPSAVVSLTLTNYDNQAPSNPSINASTTSKTNQNVVVSIVGEGTVYYSIDQVLDSSKLSNYAVYSGPLTLNQNAQVFAIAVDAAKNKSGVANITVSNIDKISPIATVVYSQTSPTKGSVFASLMVNEEYLMTNGTPRYYEFTANGTHAFNLSDLAGNLISVTATVANIDKTAPVINSSSATLNGANLTSVKGGDLIAVSIQATDVSPLTAKISLGSLLIDLPLKLESVIGNAYVFSGNVQVPTQFDGLVDLSVIAVDSAGNSSTQNLKSGLKIDNTKPVFNVALSNRLKNGFVVDTTLDFVVTNDGSTLMFGFSETGINTPIAELSTTLNQSIYNNGQVQTLYFKATDGVGNTSDVRTLSFKWDSIKPVTPVLTIEADNPTNQGVVVLNGVVENGTVVVKRIIPGGTELIYQGPTAPFVAGIEVSLRAGLNTFTLVNIDSAGNFSDAVTEELFYDHQAPVIDMTMAATGEITASTNEPLTDVIYTLDGEVQAAITFNNGIAEIPAIGEQGEHILTVTGTDEAGNIGVGRLSVIVVFANQTLEKSLSDGIHMHEGTFTETSELTLRTFEVSAGSENSFIGEPLNFDLTNGTVDPSKGVVVDLYIGLGFPSNTKVHYYEESTSTWIALDESMANGDSYYNGTDASVKVSVNPLVANAVFEDAGGTIEVAPGHLIGFLRHFSGYAAIQDTTPPTIQIITAEPATPINSETLTIQYTLSEVSEVTINGHAAGQKAAGTHQHVMTLSEGANTFTVKTVDLAGLSSTTESLSIIKDSAFETLTSSIVGLSNNATTRNGQVVVSASASDINFKRILINGVSYSSNSVSATITLNEGSNAFNVTAEDTAGNTKTDVFTITKDTQGPVIQISGVNNGDIVSGNITATVSGDGDLDHYSWLLTSLGVNATGNDTSVTHVPASGTNESYTLVVDAFDAVGNLTRITKIFTVDLGAPTISVNDYDALSKLNQALVIDVDPSDADIQLILKRNGLLYTGVTPTISVIGDVKRFGFTLSEEGNYEISIDAIKGASVATKSIELVIDKTAPVITLSGVSNGNTYTTHPTITFSSSSVITATISKNNGAQVNIGSGYTTTENGNYSLVVTSTDQAGNQAIQTVNFIVNVAANPGGGTPGDGTPGGTPGGSPVPVIPPVIEESATEDIITVKPGQNALSFEETQVFMNISRATVPAGTEIAVKRFELEDAESILPTGAMAGNKPSMTTNGMTFKVASELYDFTSSKTFTGEIEITLPYDPKKVTNPAKLTIVWFDTTASKWVTIGGKIDRKANTITFKTPHFSYYMIVEGQKTFSDLKQYSWAKDAIETLAARGIVNGFDLYSFKPGNDVTRAQFATMIVNALSLSKLSNVNGYKDLKDQWYKAAMENAVSNKILQGSNGYLMPDERITREQMAVMIVNAYKTQMGTNSVKAEALSFTDKGQVSSWAAEAISIATKLGLVSGQGNNLFAPKSFANRAEAAMMIFRLIEALEK